MGKLGEWLENKSPEYIWDNGYRSGIKQAIQILTDHCSTPWSINSSALTKMELLDKLKEEITE